MLSIDDIRNLEVGDNVKYNVYECTFVGLRDDVVILKDSFGHTKEVDLGIFLEEGELLK